MRKRSEIKVEKLDEQAKPEKLTAQKGRPDAERCSSPSVLHLPDDPAELMRNINLLNQTSINRCDRQLRASIISQQLQQSEAQTLLKLDGSFEKIETSMSSGAHDASEKLGSGIVCHLDDAGSPPMIIAAELKEEGTCSASKIDILNKLSSNQPCQNPPLEPNKRGAAKGRQTHPLRSSGKTSNQKPLIDCASDLTKQSKEEVHHASATSDDHKLGHAPRKTSETRKLGTSSENHNRLLSNSQNEQGMKIQSSYKMTKRNQDCDSVGNIQIKTSLANAVASKNSPNNTSSATFSSHNINNRNLPFKHQSSSDSCKNPNFEKNMSVIDKSQIPQACGSKRKGGQICNLESDSNKNGNASKQQDYQSQAAILKNHKNAKIRTSNIGSVNEQIQHQMDVNNEENLKQAALSQSSTNTVRETRSARRQTAKDAIDYSLYFQDYDYLSEEEEIKKKRELKKIQKSTHANKIQESKKEHVQFSKDDAQNQLKNDQSLNMKGVDAQQSNTEFRIKASNVLPNKQKDIISSPLLFNEKVNKRSNPTNQKPKAPQSQKTAEKLNQVQADPKTIATPTVSETLSNQNSCNSTPKINKTAIDMVDKETPQCEQIRTEVSRDSNSDHRVAVCEEEEKSAYTHNTKMSDAQCKGIIENEVNIKEFQVNIETTKKSTKKQELFLLLSQPVAQRILKLNSEVSSKIVEDLDLNKTSFKVPLPPKTAKPDQLFNIAKSHGSQNYSKSKASANDLLLQQVPKQEKDAKTENCQYPSQQKVQLEKAVDRIKCDAPTTSMSQTQPKIMNLEEVKEVDQYCLPEITQQDTASLEIQKKSGVDGVINPFDRSIRCMNEVDFIDFNNKNTENNQYKPALIQKEQQQDALQDPVKFAETNHSSGQTHFIHKKQSQCIIRRITGVSYVKKSESKQLNVRDRYDKLAPIVIQGSYHLPKLEDKAKLDVIQQITHQTFYSPESYFICTAFESANEVSMKNYILKPHQRLQICKGNVWLVRSNGLQDCWRFIKDKYFFCIHLMYDQERIIKNIDPEALDDNAKIAQFIQESDVCLGILTKRGTASIKSMLKVYKLDNEYNEYLKYKEMQNKAPEEEVKINVMNEENPELSPKLDIKTVDLQQFDIAEKVNCPGAVINGINTMGLMLRMELYVDEHRWKSLDTEPGKQSQVCLNSLIQSCEEQIVPSLLHWNAKRTSVIGKTQHKNDTIYKIDLTSVLSDETQRLQKRAPSIWELLQIPQEIEAKTKLEIEGIENLRLDDNPIEILNQLKNSFPTPITLINTRDCFVNDLYVKQTIMNLGPGRENVIKREYYFTPETVPENYRQVVGLPKDYDVTNIENLRVGVTSYFNFYSNEELKNMEKCIEDTEKRSLENTYLPMTAQKTFAGNQLKRTKFFFGYRYMWTKCQLLEPLSNVAAGVRADVSQPPVWMKSVLEDPLVKAKIIEKDFINSIALNVYHDGSEGLAQHFDDATRFKQPIFTVRLFSDSRLSFGSQFYGFCNGAFFVPLPRGCICVMEEGSYSANGVKHCIRPCDMTGKSSAVILRQMHPNVVKEAVKYDQHVDLPMWMSSLCLEDKAMPYYQQKEYECQAIEKVMLANAAQGNASKLTGMHGGACGEGGSTHQSTLQTLEVTSNYSVGKKRGPRITPESLEKKIQLQKQKDDREVKKVLDDMIKNIEDKHKREQDFYKRFKVVTNQQQKAKESIQEQSEEVASLTVSETQQKPLLPSLNFTEVASMQHQANQQITHPIIFESQRIRQPHLTLPLPDSIGDNAQVTSTPKLPSLMPFIIERAFRTIQNAK